MKRAALVLLAALVTGACRTQPAPEALTVAAASSLAPSFDALSQEVLPQADLSVTFTYGASGDLETQIRNGAPYDVFISAAGANVDRLVEEGLLDAESRVVIAEGRLYLVQTDEVSPPIVHLADLAREDIRRIALANPDHAPYGAAARQALQAAGVWSSIEPKVVYAETVQQAWEFVVSGNADAGLVSESLLVGSELRAFEVDRRLYDPPLYVAAIASASPNRHQAEAFLALLMGDAAQRLLAARGLLPPTSP